MKIAQGKILMVSANKRNYRWLTEKFRPRFDTTYVPLRLGYPHLDRRLFGTAILVVVELPEVSTTWEHHLSLLWSEHRVATLLIAGCCSLSRASRLKDCHPRLILSDPLEPEEFCQLIAKLLSPAGVDWLQASSPGGSEAIMSRFLGRSAAAETVRGKVQALPLTGHGLLLVGETGVGKSLLGKMIHDYHQPHRPFVEISSGAMVKTLCQCDFFGVVSGAFTGSATREGFLDAAEGGDLLFNELGCLSRSAQAALLQVLDNGSFYPVGTNLRKQATVRLIATVCNERGAGRRVRRELWYRVAQLIIRIPPLRERCEDIGLLALHFLRRCNPELSWDDRALDLLTHYHWPGNVRQLHSFIHCLCVFYLKEGKEVDKKVLCRAFADQLRFDPEAKSVVRSDA